MKYYVIYSHSLSADPIKWLFSQLHNYNLIKQNYLLYNMWNLLRKKLEQKFFGRWTPNETKWHRRAKLSSGALIEYCNSLRIRRLRNMVSMAASGTNERERASKRQSSLSISPQPSKAVVSARSLPLGTSVVKLFNRRVIQGFPASSSFDHFNYCLF